MKLFNYGLILLAALLFMASGCKKEEDGPVDESSSWNFTTTITFASQGGITYVAEGTALYERRGENFKVTTNYTIGQASYQNIKLEGKVNGDQVEFDPDPVIIDFEVGGTPVTQEIILSLDPVTVAGSSATGSGFIQQRVLPDGPLETGTFVFSASKQ